MNEFLKYGKVFITSEQELPNELKPKSTIVKLIQSPQIIAPTLYVPAPVLPGEHLRQNCQIYD